MFQQHQCVLWKALWLTPTYPLHSQIFQLSKLLERTSIEPSTLLQDPKSRFSNVLQGNQLVEIGYGGRLLLRILLMQSSTNCRIGCWCIPNFFLQLVNNQTNIFFQESQPSFMHTHFSVIITYFLFLSFPSRAGASHNRLFFLGLWHCSSSSALALHALVGLELAMTSSGCSVECSCCNSRVG